MQVISDTVQVFEGLQTVFSVEMPKEIQFGDRVIVIVSGSATAFGNSASASAGWRTIGGTTVNTVYVTAFEPNTLTVPDLTLTQAQPSAALVRVISLRGASTASFTERVTFGVSAGTSADPAALAPSWGNAKTMWIAACAVGTVGIPVPPLSIAPKRFTTLPSTLQATRVDSIAQAGMSGHEMASGRFLQKAASVDLTPFVVGATGDLAGILIAVRPAGTAGAPVRAPEQFNGRLVVCNASDVLQSTAGSFADQGGLFISPELETASIYAMGIGGTARHRAITFVGEFRDACTLACELSYDDGLNYVSLTPFTLERTDYAVGQAVRVRWVPRRRKVNGVRARFRVIDSGGGPSEGLAFHQAIFQFEETVGGARQAAGLQK